MDSPTCFDCNILSIGQIPIPTSSMNSLFILAIELSGCAARAEEWSGLAFLYKRERSTSRDSSGVEGIVAISKAHDPGLCA